MSSQPNQARGLIILNGRTYPVSRVLAALERQAMMPLRTVGEELWIGNERIQPFSKTSPEQAMMLTCYGSLAYCCSLSRECNLRDEAIRLLGMSKEEYKAIQQECHHRFLRFFESRWPHDEIITEHPQATHSSYLPFTEEHPSADVEPHWGTRASSSSTTRRKFFSQDSGDAAEPMVDLGSLFGSTAEEKVHRRPVYPESQSIDSRTSSELGSYSPDEFHPSHIFSELSQSAPASTPRGFCIYCGQDLIGDSDFCSRCGRSQK
ncbi:MAG: hypothetical protein ACFFDP_08645 [Promethearchaeota archaeon]